MIISNNVNYFLLWTINLNSIALVDEKNARTIISNNTQLRELCYETTKSHAAFNKTIVRIKNGP